MTIAVPSLRAVVCAPGWVRNDLWRRARAVPSLDLRFADSKSLVDAITGQNLITFTRSGDGTFVNSAGVLQTAAAGVPRFDHNPVTGESLGLLVEESRTNLLLRSEGFETTWVNGGINAFGSGSISNTTATTAPNGTFGADKIVESSGGTTHFVAQSFTTTTSTVYTLSLFAKAAERSRIGLYFGGGGGAAQGIIVNLANGTFAANIVANPTSYSIIPFGNGWYRISITGTSTGTVAQHVVYICNDSNAFSYSGDGTSGVYIWGAQLEAGAFPTSYIPTTGSAATRNADVVSITGANFSSWYRQAEGAYYWEGVTSDMNPSGFPQALQANDGTASNRIQIVRNNASSNARLAVVSGGSAQAAADATAWSLGQRTRISLGYAVDNFALVANGGAITTDTLGSVPSVSRMEIGQDVNAVNILNGAIRRIAYWPARLSNATLQSISQ